MTREESIAKLTTPTGRVFEVVPWEINPALYITKYADKVPGELPVRLQDHKFTTRSKAVAYIQGILREAWDHAEDHSPKRSKVA